MLDLDLVRLDDLVGDPTNPKDHDVGAVDSSVSRFGFVDPVIVDARTGKLVSGHGRLAALRQRRKAGEHPPANVEVDDDGEWLVPAVTGWASRSDVEARAVIVALNRTTELGGWDLDKLSDLLVEVADSDAGLVGTGYDGDDLDDLLARLDESRPLTAPARPDDGTAREDAGGDAALGVRAVDDESYDEFIARYANRAVRNLVLDYPVPVFAWLVERLDELREDDDETNAEVLLRLVAEETGQSPPEVETG